MHVQASADLAQAWSRVAALASAVDAGLDRWLAENHRLGLTELRALEALAPAPDQELRVNDLAAAVGLNPSSTTRLLSRLEAKDLARRDVCEADGRGVYAVLSDTGAETLRTVREPYAARVDELLAQSGPELAAALELVRGRVAP